MAAKPTNFQEFDPDNDYEILPPSSLYPATPDAVNCCRCVDGNQTLCNEEVSMGAFVTAAAAQGIAYWYSS